MKTLVRSCWYCRRPAPADATFCPRCGSRPDRDGVEVFDEFGRRCPGCDLFYPDALLPEQDVLYCVECGTAITLDDQVDVDWEPTPED